MRQTGQQPLELLDMARREKAADQPGVPASGGLGELGAQRRETGGHRGQRGERDVRLEGMVRLVHPGAGRSAARCWSG
ncbi:hypothetical protein [Streptomyces tubercidicus]